MKILEQERFHGAALTQIVKHRSFKALNRASDAYGHYLVNTDRQLFVKYRTNTESPWTFVFPPAELRELGDALGSGDHTYVSLVCGCFTVCCLNKDELAIVLDFGGAGQQSVRVEVPPGGSCHVSGSNGALTRTVPHNSFPNKVFI